MSNIEKLAQEILDQKDVVEDLERRVENFPPYIRLLEEKKKLKEKEDELKDFALYDGENYEVTYRGKIIKVAIVQRKPYYDKAKLEFLAEQDSEFAAMLAKTLSESKPFARIYIKRMEG